MKTKRLRSRSPRRVLLRAPEEASMNKNKNRVVLSLGVALLTSWSPPSLLIEGRAKNRRVELVKR
jgi:hypothetical protein